VLVYKAHLNLARDVNTQEIILSPSKKP